MKKRIIGGNKSRKINKNKNKGEKVFRNAQIGDMPWSNANGWGKIIEVRKETSHITVMFEDNKTEYFTLDGKRNREDKYPTLFWDEVKFEIPKRPLNRLEIDTKVLVWDGEGHEKQKRHFKGFTEHGEIICFPNGTTSWSVFDNSGIVWKNWELA